MIQGFQQQRRQHQSKPICADRYCDEIVSPPSASPHIMEASCCFTNRIRSSMFLNSVIRFRAIGINALFLCRMSCSLLFHGFLFQFLLFSICQLLILVTCFIEHFTEDGQDLCNCKHKFEKKKKRGSAPHIWRSHNQLNGKKKILVIFFYSLWSSIFILFSGIS